MGWFDAFPAGDSARDLRNRFRKDDPRQHYRSVVGAVPLHVPATLGLRGRGPSDVRGSNTHPDFLARSERGAFYIEAATTFSGIQDDEEHSALEPQIMDAIERVRSETFTISVDFERIGPTCPECATSSGRSRNGSTGSTLTMLWPRMCFLAALSRFVIGSCA